MRYKKYINKYIFIYTIGLGKKTCYFYDTSSFIKTISFRFSLEAFSNLHCFVLSNFILKRTKYQIIKKVTTIIEQMKVNCR